MKKFVLLSLAAVSLVVSLFCSSCHRQAFATGPEAPKGDTTWIVFTKSLKQRLEHDNIEVTKVQFYIDHRLTLRRTMGSEKGKVQSGVIIFDNGQYINEMVIPAYTPGICERVSGDAMKISFDVAGKTLEFAALYNNNNFVLVGNNWHNGTVDVEYDNQTYQVTCDCGNAAEAKLVVRRNQVYQKDNNAKVMAGRKVN